MLKWRTLLFDFDYTIADSSEGIVKCYNTTFSSMGLPECNPVEIKNTIGKSLRQSLSELKKDVGSIDYKIFRDLFMKNSEKFMIDHSYVYDKVYELFQWAKQKGLNIGVVTSKDAKTVEDILLKYNCRHLVDVVVGEEDTMKHKPDKEPIESAIQYLRCTKDDVVFFGDSVIDAEAAQNAGVEFYAILSGTTSYKMFISCGIKIDGYYESVSDLFTSLLKSEKNK